jgi:hypothetical protein
MYLRATAVIVAALCAAASQAAPPDGANITNGFKVDAVGPERIEPGEIAVITTGDSTAKRYAFTVIPASKNFYIDTGGQKAYLAGKSGTFTVVLVGIDGELLAIDTHTVTIVATPVPPGPGPGPGPTPPPDPLPDVPDGKLGFTKLAFTEGMKVALPTRQKAAALADNFTSVASAISAGAIRTVEEANAEVSKKNREVLQGAARDAWMPFLQAWSDKADAALKAGTLRGTVQEYRDIYMATEQGLRRVQYHEAMYGQGVR